MNNKIRNKVVVIGGDHYNTLWAIRSLGQIGIKPYVVVHGILNNSFVFKSKYCNKCYALENLDELEELLLLNFYDSQNKTIIICSSDKAAVAVDNIYDKLGDDFLYPHIIGHKGELESFMSKEQMCLHAENAGFLVPKSWNIDISNLDFVVPHDIVFPCIIKPLISCNGAKTDFRICSNITELIDQMNNLQSTCSKLLIQEYLKPDFEISILGVNLLNAKKNIIPGLLHKTNTCKSIHNIGMPSLAFVDDQIDKFISEESVKKFMHKMPFYGNYSIEFFVSQGKVYFLEINLRTDGDLFVYTSAGVNMIYLWILDLLNLPIKDYQLVVDNNVYGMTEISYLKYLPSKNPIRILSDFTKTKCFSIFDKSDIKPFLYKFIYAF